MLWKDKAALMLISFYFLHVLGLLYTTDFEYAFKDLRVKLPLLFLPVVFATSKPLAKEKADILFLVFMASVLVASLISFWIYIFGDIHDFRELSPFISHIRLSLNACLAVFFAAFFAYSFLKSKKIVTMILAIFILWLVMFLVMIESVTGLIIVLAVLYCLLIAGIFKLHHIALKVSSLVLIIAIPLAIGIYLNRTVNEFLHPVNNDLDHLELFTKGGNPYTHDTVLQPVENGSYVGIYVCEQELRTQWNQISEFEYDGSDEQSQDIKYTLIRYLNSKGFRKDSTGVAELSSMDVRNIEKGIANVYYTKPISINSRIYKLLWEYQMSRLNGNPGGHSMSQRIEFWKVSLAIIRQNIVFGVGTGDIKQAYADMYISLSSELEPQFRHRAHNQYLAIFVTFGFVGLIWFIVSLVYPGFKKAKIYQFRYFAFWLTMMISMLVEDTLETQMGVTLFAFFNSFLLFGIADD